MERSCNSLRFPESGWAGWAFPPFCSIRLLPLNWFCYRKCRTRSISVSTLFHVRIGCVIISTQEIEMTRIFSAKSCHFYGIVSLFIKIFSFVDLQVVNAYKYLRYGGIFIVSLILRIKINIVKEKLYKNIICYVVWNFLLLS